MNHLQTTARLAQTVECKALNLVVMGSSPTVGVVFLCKKRKRKATEKGKEV